jgi:hypothetical protein
MVIVSCEVVSRSKQNKEHFAQDINHGKKESETVLPSSGSKQSTKNEKPTGEIPPITSPKPKVTHYDTKKLDEDVREEAKKLKVDPKKHRMLVRTDPDNTKIYRMLGKHVIVNPNGERVYLPDEL